MTARDARYCYSSYFCGEYELECVLNIKILEYLWIIGCGDNDTTNTIKQPVEGKRQLDITIFTFRLQKFRLILSSFLSLKHIQMTKKRQSLFLPLSNPNNTNFTTRDNNSDNSYQYTFETCIVRPVLCRDSVNVNLLLASGSLNLLHEFKCEVNSCCLIPKY